MARKNVTAKIAAVIALVAISASIIGTGVLVIVETYFSKNVDENSISEQQLQELLKNYSGSTASTGVTISNSGETLTGTTK